MDRAAFVTALAQSRRCIRAQAMEAESEVAGRLSYTCHSCRRQRPCEQLSSRTRQHTAYTLKMYAISMAPSCKAATPHDRLWPSTGMPNACSALGAARPTSAFEAFEA